MRIQSLDDLKTVVAVIQRRLELHQQHHSKLPQETLLGSEADDFDIPVSLANMTDEEAVDLLRHLQSERELKAYFILGERLSDKAMAEVCLAWFSNPVLVLRIIAVGDIATYLRGSKNREASRELALIVRNAQEFLPLRRLAYCSLLSINDGDFQLLTENSVLEELSEDAVRPANDAQTKVNWEFVDSFL